MRTSPHPDWCPSSGDACPKVQRRREGRSLSLGPFLTSCEQSANESPADRDSEPAGWRATPGWASGEHPEVRESPGSESFRSPAGAIIRYSSMPLRGLDVDGSACFLELGLERVGLFPGHAFLHR